MNLIDLIKYVNTKLHSSATKPTPFLSDKEKRAIRYAEAYAMNINVIYYLNRKPEPKAVQREL